MMPAPAVWQQRRTVAMALRRDDLWFAAALIVIGAIAGLGYLLVRG